MKQERKDMGAQARGSATQSVWQLIMQFMIWVVCLIVACVVVENMTGWTLTGQVLASSLPAFLWIYWTRRVWALTRVHKSKSLRRLAWVMTSAFAPMPIYWLSEPLRLASMPDVNKALNAWLVIFSIASLFLGFLIHSIAQSTAESQGLAVDSSLQQAALSERRRQGGRDKGALRWLQMVVMVGGVVMMFWAMGARGMSSEESGLMSAVMGALTTVSVFAFHWVWTRHSPQRGAAFSAILAISDVLLPWAVATFSFLTALLSMSSATPAKRIGISVGITLCAVLLQVPSALMRWERRRWRKGWRDELVAALAPSGVEVLAQGQDPCALETALRAPVNAHEVADLRFLMRCASVKDEEMLVTGDDAFDAHFAVSGDPLHAVGLLTARARAAAMALYEQALTIDQAAATCVVDYPWRVEAQAKELAALAGLVRLPVDSAPRAQVRARAMDSALTDPVPSVRCMCAQALLDVWRAEGELTARLRKRLAHDAPSVALLDGLSECAPSAIFRERLLDPTPWPEVGGAFAQALWVLALDQLNDEDERAALSPPTGRLGALDVPFAMPVAVSAGALEVHAAEPWVLEVLARARYAEHRVKLCQALAVIGTVQSLSALRVLAHDEAAQDSARDAARLAADAIARRSDLSDIAGGLALSDASDQGALSIASGHP
jgi:hypothetical protein